MCTQTAECAAPVPVLCPAPPATHLPICGLWPMRWAHPALARSGSSNIKQTSKHSWPALALCPPTRGFTRGPGLVSKHSHNDLSEGFWELRCLPGVGRGAPWAGVTGMEEGGHWMGDMKRACGMGRAMGWGGHRGWGELLQAPSCPTRPPPEALPQP